MNGIQIPHGASSIIAGLQREGHEAYVVGGCVRDSLLGNKPDDWDICSSATPDKIRDYLNRHGIQAIDTGLKHGTITANFGNGEQYEITTFRMDGIYSDGRRPDKVTFIDDIIQDLSRRDFTINAMAFNQKNGLIDPLHGQRDLEHGIISCVGNPNDRFSEDALRILRALRFSSVYGFQIESQTAASVHKNKDNLCNVSAERIRSELCKMLNGKDIFRVLNDFSDVITVIIPELKPCIGFNQNNRYHQYTVYEHIAHAVDNYKGNDISVKVALLLHDIGKPLCYTEDKNGGHFYGHAIPGHNIAEKVVDRLRFDNMTKSDVLELVLYHDSVIEPTAKTVRRWLNKIGENRLSQLIDMKMADIHAHTEGTQSTRIAQCYELKSLMSPILEEQQCFSIKDMAISGTDVMALGVPEGKKFGYILNTLLDEVISERIPNDHEALLHEAVRFL